MSHKFWLARIATFVDILAFSLITLAVAAAHISASQVVGYSVPVFAGLAVAISVITILVILPMFIIDLIRGGAFSSLIVVELGVTGVLMVLWLAMAATTADFTSGRIVSCSNTEGEFGTICRTYQATEAFAFINWLILLFYFGTLLTFSIIAHTRRNPPWTGTVRTFEFLSKGKTLPGVEPMIQQTASSQQSIYSEKTVDSPQITYPQLSTYPTATYAQA